jgi:hypothetical protein
MPDIVPGECNDYIASGFSSYYGLLLIDPEWTIRDATDDSIVAQHTAMVDDPNGWDVVRWQDASHAYLTVCAPADAAPGIYYATHFRNQIPEWIGRVLITFVYDLEVLDGEGGEPEPEPVPSEWVLRCGGVSEGFVQRCHAEAEGFVQRCHAEAEGFVVREN